METGPKKNRYYVKCYVCSTASKRGTSVCPVTHRERQDVLEEKVLADIERILSPDELDGVLKGALKQAKSAHKRDPNVGKKLDADIRRLERDRDNLVAALKRGGSKPDVVLTEITRLGKLIEQRKEEKNALPQEEATVADIEALKAQMTHRLQQFRQLMRTDIPAARIVLRKLLNGHKLKAHLSLNGHGKKTFEVRGDAWLGALLNPASEASATKSWI
jgi:hypothetical protein